LIHPEFVLSAAHCFLYPDEEVAVFFKTIFYDDFSSEKQAIVKKVIIHENWDEETQLNDVALIQIEPVDFVSPVSMNRDRSLPVPGEPAVVVGYGEVEPDLFAYVLQEAELFITSDEKCNEEHQRTGGTDAVSMICALDATESQDACVGDSGGPLILLGATPDQDVVVGVVSSGDGECGQNTKGGVYSEVAFFADWVQATICKNAIVTPKDCDATAPLASKTYEVSPRDDNGSGAVNAASSASFISIIGTISILLLPLLVEL
jgi:secreted trypsin-like serine protease